LLALKNQEVVSVDLNDAPAGITQEQQQDNQRELPAATGVIELNPGSNKNDRKNPVQIQE